MSTGKTRRPPTPGRVECRCPPEVRGACGCAPRYLPRAPIAVGAVAGTLTVTAGDVYRPSPVPGRRFERWVEARCTCGRVTQLRAHAWLAAERTGRAVTCGGRAHDVERAARQPHGAAHPSARYEGPVPRTFMAWVRANARAQAKKRARRGETFAFTVTHADLAALWLAQEGRCAYTGLALTLSTRARENTASLDRIDSGRGYVLGNVQLVHKVVNALKRDLPESAFLQLAGAVARQAARPAEVAARTGRPSARARQLEFSGWLASDDAALLTANAAAPVDAVPAAGLPGTGIPRWVLGGMGKSSVASLTNALVSTAWTPEFVKAAPNERTPGGRTRRRAVFRCRACAAGRTFEARVENVRSGNTRSCGCLAVRSRAAVRRPVAGLIGRTYWAEVRHNARARDLTLDLAPEAAWVQYLAQAGRCALTGWRIDFAGERLGRRRQTASLDRIDAARGYAPDNVMWTHKAVNVSRRDLSVTAFVGWCTAIAAHRRRRARAGAAFHELPLFGLSL